jgi:hypothetical protein
MGRKDRMASAARYYELTAVIRAVKDKAMILAQGSSSPLGRAVDGKGGTDAGRKSFPYVVDLGEMRGGATK